nr:MAG TPA: YvrJ protein family protein [Bacteriophage sp.]
MDVDTIIQLITTLGFPIVCCVALFLRMIKSDEQHKEEMNKLSESLNNNTLAINKLNERLNHEEN